MFIIVIAIVIFVIIMQVVFFIKNLHRMNEFKEIFQEEDSYYGLKKDQEFVCGITGKGNEIFDSIKKSINKYLDKNQGSVIDFSLLKDAVDRHCDAVEDDINTLTPVPLYCGLAGTMAGVIVGLGSLLTTGSIKALLTPGGATFTAATTGVNDLLAGVAWAMVASICGILLTTIASLLFKKSKQEEEARKNTFLAWMQSRLLPELPSDTSKALTALAKNLNRFNNTFSTNVTTLGQTLDKVNDAYKTSAKVVETVQGMDFMKMAKANVKVLTEFQNCSDQLEAFMKNLNAMQDFIPLFQQESERLQVLESIRDYFDRHKGEVVKDTADTDKALKDALQSMKEGTTSNINELNTALVKQAEDFKKIVEEEKSIFEKLVVEEKISFEKLNKEIQQQFTDQMRQLPTVASRLSDIAGIPSKLDKLIAKMEKSNASMVKEVKEYVEGIPVDGNGGGNVTRTFPQWMKWVIVVSLVLIAFASMTNAFFFTIAFSEPENTDWVEVDTADTAAIDTSAADTINN